mgnify:FL=1
MTQKAKLTMNMGQARAEVTAALMPGMIEMAAQVRETAKGILLRQKGSQVGLAEAVAAAAEARYPEDAANRNLFAASVGVILQESGFPPIGDQLGRLMRFDPRKLDRQKLILLSILLVSEQAGGK